MDLSNAQQRTISFLHGLFAKIDNSTNHQSQFIRLWIKITRCHFNSNHLILLCSKKRNGNFA